ncbi:MAG: M28 family peptidase, partial [Candidatus Bathyarchaeota archaeon]|nr:M28 family peptidase [Candidatus Bathyarchaeota archaeon]
MLQWFITSLLMVAFFVHAFGVESTGAYQSEGVVNEISTDYVAPALQMINLTELEEHVKVFSSFGSRFTGYPGNERAFEYIVDQLEAFGLGSNIEVHRFDSLVPINEGAYLELSTGENITLYPLLPNMVCPPQTPPGGISGKVLSLGEGQTSVYDGKDVNGSIVLMNFNVQYNWLKAIKYGAKAVIFKEPEDSNYNEAYMKGLRLVAVNIPRFLARSEDAAKLEELLKSGGVSGHLVSNNKWRMAESKNIIAFLPGEGILANEYILLTAHYDSFSWIPDIAPGAEEAVGPSMLLQMARYYTSNPATRRYTLVFVFFSGNDQGVVGSRSFVTDYIDSATKFEEWAKNIVLQMDFDISGTNRIVMPTVVSGWLFYWSEVLAPWISDFAKWITSVVLPDMASKMNKPQLLNNLILDNEALILQESYGDYFGAGWGGGEWDDAWAVPKRYSGSEPLQNIGGPAFCWLDYFEQDKYWGTILDTNDKIRYGNILFQLETIYPIVNLIVQTDLRGSMIIGEWSPSYCKGGGWPSRVNAIGKILQYDPIEGWYTPVPNAIVAFAKPAPTTMGQQSYPRAFNHALQWFYTLSDDKGNVFMPNILGPGGRGEGLGTYAIQAYKIDEETGDPVMAPALGTYWYPGCPMATKGRDNAGTTMNFVEQILNNSFGAYVLFNCSNIVMFDVGDIYTRGGAFDRAVTIEVNNFRAHVPPDQSSYDIYIPLSGEGIAALHVPPDEPLEILTRVNYVQRLAETVLNNASEINPQGTGYTLRPGETLTLTHTALRQATSWQFVIQERVSLLESKGVSVQGVNITQLEDLVNSAWKALEERNYTKLESIQNMLLVMEFEGYANSRATMEDTINTITFFGAILVPFALLAERLFIQRMGFQRIILSVLCFMLPLAFLYGFHPGFILASNSMMVIIGFVVLVLTMPIIGILISNAEQAFRMIRTKVFGAHWVEVTRTAAVLLAFSTGILNMRKRPLRTALMLISITCVTTGMVMFTSVSGESLLRVRLVPDVVAQYEGLLIHQWHYSDDLTHFFGEGVSQSTPQVGTKFLDELRARYGDKATIIPRCWQYITGYRRGVRAMDLNASVAYNVPIIALAGYTPEEDNLTNLSLFFAPGSGSRWFVSEDDGEYRAIISDNMAKALNLTVGGQFIIGGYDFTVIGIMTSKFNYEVWDLDGVGLAPIDPRVPGYQTSILIREIIIVPYKTLLSTVGDRVSSMIVSAALKIRSEYANITTLSEIAEELYMESGMRMPLWFGIGGEVYIIDRTAMINLYGWESQYVSLAIASMAILSLLVGSIEERRHEIFIYSSVGFSPFHVAFLFLAEVLAYALIGGVFGCLIGMIMTYLGTSISGGELLLNFASSRVITTVSIVMTAITAAAIYPIRHASRIVTPSLERRWRLPQPKGDEWVISLPMS